LSRYRYTGPGATYPSLDITVVTGDVVDIPAGMLPDANWVPGDERNPITVRSPLTIPINGGPVAWTNPKTGVLDYSDGSSWKPGLSAVAGVRRSLPKPSEVDAVMASPPSIAATASATVITSAVKWPSITTSGTSRIPTDHFNYLGAGGFATYGTTFPDYTYVAPTNGSTGWTSAYVVEFFFDGTTVDLIFKGIGGPGQLRIRVDGQLVSATPISLGVTGGDQIVPITFATRQPRRISVEATVAPWGGVNVGPNDTVWKSDTRGPRCIVIGDSFVNGTGAAGAGCTAFVRRFSQAMGWPDTWASGIGGTGILNPGSFVKFRDRIATDCTAWNPDVVVIVGSVNDTSFSAAQVQAESALLFQQIRAALPSVLLIVTAPTWKQGVSSYNNALLQIRDGIKTAALAAGGYFVDWLEKPLDTTPITTTLASAASASATTISANALIPIQSTLDIDAAGTRERRRVLNVAGSGPFTLTLDVALTAAHSSGATVTQVGPSHWTGTGKVGTTTGVGNCDLIVSADATHPSQAGHDYLGSDLAMLVARAVLAP
jgi:lysophospholipase L1-like esterase